MKQLVLIAVLLLAGMAGGVAEDPGLTPDQARILEGVRAAALQYTETLPNFICTQTTHREVQDEVNFGIPFNGASSSRGGGGSAGGASRGPSGVNDLIEERLTFFDQMEHYEVVAVNGKKAVGKQHMQFGGAISAGEFGSALHNLFDPHSHAKFSWEKAVRLSGRNVYVYKFDVPSENGTIVMDRDTDQKVLVASTGRLFVDIKTFEVVRITSTLELPVDFPIKMATIAVEYKPVDIAGKTYNLPSRSEVRLKDVARLYVNRIEFRNYQKFGAESTIHYDSNPPQPKP